MPNLDSRQRTWYIQQRLSQMKPLQYIDIIYMSDTGPACLHGSCTCEVLYTLILSTHWYFLHVDVVYMDSAHEIGSSRWYCLHVEIIYTLTHLLHTNNVDTLIITITFKISLRYLGLHAAFTALLVHTALTRLVDTNGVHTPHYGDYTSKVQHIALLR